MNNGGRFNDNGDIQFNGPATYSRPGSSGSVTMPNDQITAQFTALFANARTPAEQAEIRRQYALAMQAASDAGNPNSQANIASAERTRQNALADRAAMGEMDYRFATRANNDADARTQSQYTQAQFNMRNDPALGYMQHPQYQNSLLRGAMAAGDRGDLLGNNPAYRPAPYRPQTQDISALFGGFTRGMPGGQPATQPQWTGGTYQPMENGQLQNFLSRLMGGR